MKFLILFATLITAASASAQTGGRSLAVTLPQGTSTEMKEYLDKKVGSPGEDLRKALLTALDDAEKQVVVKLLPNQYMMILEQQIVDMWQQRLHSKRPIRGVLRDKLRAALYNALGLPEETGRPKDPS